jgi:uncharacterized iron-regulated membrane protein
MSTHLIPDSPESATRAIPPPAPTPATGPGCWALLRPLILRIHFYAGILIGPFLLIAAFTGLLYTATPQIEGITYHELTHVTAGGPTKPLSAQVAAARASHPTGDILEVDPPEAADRTTRVVFSDSTVPSTYAMSVFVDPHDAQVVGRVRSMGQWLGIRAWIDDLHRNLHLGAFGRNYSELAASWLWVVLLGGLALWIGRRRKDKRLRRLITPDLRTTGRGRSLSWHGAVGTLIAIGLLGLSVSGLTWSRYTGAKISDLRSELSWTTPSPSTALPHAEHTTDDDMGDMSGMSGMSGMTGMAGMTGKGGTSSGTSKDAAISEGVGIDGVYQTARTAGLGNPLVLTPPADDDSAWTAGENKRSWPTHYDTITVDPADGRILHRVNSADWPFMAKVSDWIVGAHMGILFGLPNQLALACLAIGLIVVILYGYRMWWQRRPRGASALRFGPAPARGAWRRLPVPVLLVLLAAVVFVGWLMPLLGISLVVFLLLDAILQGVRSRRYARTGTS